MEGVTLAQLKAFVAAAEARSFTAAGRRLGTSQATVSEHVGRLEESLNALLFVRHRAGLVLTPAAEELLPHARTALGAVEAGTESVRFLSSLQGGVSTFGVLRYAAYYDLSDLAVRFHHRYPGVRIRMVGLHSGFVAASVREGVIEAGLVVLPVDVEGLTVKPLARDEVVLASATRPADAGPVAVEELAGQPLVLYDAYAGWLDPTRRQLQERALRLGVELDATIEVELAETAVQLVAAGAGSSVFARALTMSASFPANVRSFSFDPPLYDTIALVTRRNAYLSPATLRFARMAEAAILNTFRARLDDSWRIPSPAEGPGAAPAHSSGGPLRPGGGPP